MHFCTGASISLEAFSDCSQKMTAILKKYWFFGGIILVMIGGFGLHDQHLWLRKYDVSSQ